MKKIILLVLLSTLIATGCTKRCACVRYDGDVDYLSQDNLDARGTSCSEAIYLDHLRYYSLCEWEYK